MKKTEWLEETKKAMGELENSSEDLQRRIDEGQITWLRRLIPGMEKVLLATEAAIRLTPKSMESTGHYEKLILLKAKLEDALMELKDPERGIEADIQRFIQKELLEYPELVETVLKEFEAVKKEREQKNKLKRRMKNEKN